MLKSHEPSYQVVLTRFDNYYRGPARVKNAIFRVMTDLNAATIAIQAGDIDIGEIASSSFSNIESDSNLKTEVFESLRIDYFIPNHNAFPFNNKLVRQAVSYAIDRQLIIDSSMDGFGSPTSVMIPRSVVGYSDKIKQAYHYELEKAKALLVEAGIETPLDIGVIKCFDSHKIEVQVLQQTLAELGLNATIEVMELNKLVEEFKAGDYVIGAIGISLYTDADAYSLLFAKDGGFNFSGYSNPEMEVLFAQGRTEQDIEKREEIYAKIYAIADEDVVYIPAYYRKTILAYNKDLKVDYFDNRQQKMYEMHWD
jgi:peptide/nickel transport system substrate-binding protein